MKKVSTDKLSKPKNEQATCHTRPWWQQRINSVFVWAHGKCLSVQTGRTARRRVLFNSRLSINQPADRLNIVNAVKHRNGQFRRNAWFSFNSHVFRRNVIVLDRSFCEFHRKRHPKRQLASNQLKETDWENNPICARFAVQISQQTKELLIFICILTMTGLTTHAYFMHVPPSKQTVPTEQLNDRAFRHRTHRCMRKPIKKN